MEREISPLEARAALDTIDRGRRQVVDEIDLPPWYWWGLALGWVGLGIITFVAFRMVWDGSHQILQHAGRFGLGLGWPS